MSKKQARLEALERQVERIGKRIECLTVRDKSVLRRQLFIFVGGIVIGLIACGIVGWLGLICFFVEISVFVYGWRVRRALQQSISGHRTWLDIKKIQLARMRLDWENIPPVEDKYESDHPFEDDLDITGTYSLHQLVNTGYSAGGQERLRQWLLTRLPDREIIHSRQLLVCELISLTSFRNKLQFHSQRVNRENNPLKDGEMVRSWLELPLASNPPLYALVISSLLTVLVGVLSLLYVYRGLSLIFVLGALTSTVIWSLFTIKYRARLFDDASMMYDIFEQLSAVFTFLEKYPYGKYQQLKQRCEPFYGGKQKPSALLKRLKWIARGARGTQAKRPPQSPTTLAALENQLVMFLFNVLIPWDLFLSYQLALCKEQARSNIPKWLDTWYELEALCSLATFAYLNPDFTMPKIVNSEEHEPNVAFRATALGHPLIEDEFKVVNDVAFEQFGEIIIITGSNMAGKSTFLRTIGINLCMAYAGGAVNAASLQTMLFELCCCIRVTDSLADGYSYFYAEVKRLKYLLTHLQEGSENPIFFLIDEMFSGTNNRERLIGSYAYIYALSETACCGAISTHDLELVKLAEELPQIKNYHFREEVVDREMVFDYKLYPGPCRTTHALKIMQMEGLPTTWRRALM